MGVRRLARLFVSRASLLSGIEKSGSSLLFSSPRSSLLSSSSSSSFSFLSPEEFSSLFLFRFFFLSGRRGGGGGTNTRSFLPSFFFIPLEPLKAKFQRFQKEASELHALSDFDTFHLPSPLPLPAKGRTAGSLSVASSN